MITLLLHRAGRWLLIGWGALSVGIGCGAATLTPDLLNFEAATTTGAPSGWQTRPTGAIRIDRQIVHAGAQAVRIEGSATGLANMQISLPLDFVGRELRLKARLRSQDLSGNVALWMRQDGAMRGLALNNMSNQPVTGTTGWAAYEIKLPVHPDARTLFFGVFVSGTGTAWVDDVELLVDDRPIWEAPKRPRPKQTVLDTDHEFDAGSGIAPRTLGATQVDNLVRLGKVWGFLKYHHPAVVAGQKHWDYALLRVLPAVLAAPDRSAANALITRWITDLGLLEPCNPCASLAGADLQLRPALDWIRDEAVLGAELSRSLRAVYENRPAGERQFYVSLVDEIGKPSFDHEPDYADIKLPDMGFQLLALYRFWNIVEYWFPYRDVIGEDWDGVLARSIASFASAADRAGLQRKLMPLIAALNDTHAMLAESAALRPPAGACRLPLTMRFVEGQAVVASLPSRDLAGTFAVGDAITAIDGHSVAALIRVWAPYYSASNTPTRLRNIGEFLTQGACGAARFRISRAGREFELSADRIPSESVRSVGDHDQAGPTFRLLSADVGYLKLSSIKAADVPSHLAAAATTRGLIIDIRNYPNELVVRALGSRLVERETPFVRFTNGDPANPGAFRWTRPFTLSPGSPRYAGQVVILVDERTQSRGEYTAMALRAAPGAIVVGSTTAGADGDVSSIPLPGGLSTLITGTGVFYPERRPTQRVGIIPDRFVEPTIAGIRAGRDEVLEAGIREILGGSTPPQSIEAMARRMP